MYLNILDDKRITLLHKILKSAPVPDCYLAGGTALALQIGHRLSYDFDFFVSQKFNVEDIASTLEQLGSLEILYMKDGTFHGLLDGVNVTYLYYPNPVLSPLVIDNDMPKLKMASLLDIAIMKWVAISSRGCKRDFVDLYQICQNGLELEDILNLIPQKFPGKNINSYHMLQSIYYFDDADLEPELNMLIDYDWEKIKVFFINNQKNLLKNILI